MKTKTYLETPLGLEAAEYLRVKTKRLTDASERMYEQVLGLFALHHPNLNLVDFEPPDGTRLLEDFLEYHWGDKNPKTYNAQVTS